MALAPLPIKQDAHEPDPSIAASGGIGIWEAGEGVQAPPMTDMSDTTAQPVPFTLDGREVSALPGETIWQAAARLGTVLPHLCYAPEPGYRADGNCRACMVEIEGERALAVLPAAPCGGYGREQRGRPPGTRPAHGAGTAACRPAGRRPRPRIALWRVDCRCRPRSGAAAGAQDAGRGCQPPGHGGQSRRLHPLQSLRARLPGSAGQRCHRHGRARGGGEDRLRFRRPHGPLDLRGLRRVRAGLPPRAR